MKKASCDGSFCRVINLYPFCKHPGRVFLITFMLHSDCSYMCLYSVTDGFSVLQVSWFAWLSYVSKPLLPTHKGNRVKFQDGRLPFSTPLKEMSSAP